MQKYRELECEKLPERVTDAIKQRNAEREKIQDESNIVSCNQDSCNIRRPEFSDCSILYCKRSEKVCSGLGPLQNCDMECAEQAIKIEPGCQAVNEVLQKEYDYNLQHCDSSSRLQLDTCQSNRQDRIAQLKAGNQRAEEQIVLLKNSIDTMTSKMETCDSILN
jgi:hypothetical protein